MKSFKTSFQDGCSTIASKITSCGVSTASNASPTTMSNNIQTIYNNRYNAGYNAGTNEGYNRGYSAGVTDADGRANPNSINYKTGYNAGVSAGGVSSFVLLRAEAATYQLLSNGTQQHYFYLTTAEAGYKYISVSAAAQSNTNGQTYNVNLENAGTSQIVIQRCQNDPNRGNVYGFIIKNPSNGCKVNIVHYGTSSCTFIVIGMK